MDIRKGPVARLGPVARMSFWQGKRVLVTGHTGFKGSWLCEWLLGLGADVAGFALQPEPHQHLFDDLCLGARMDHALGDIRDAEMLARRVQGLCPEVVFHLAAQPLVLDSYRDPVGTWSTNVIGTLHLTEALRALDAPCAAVMVTTDKVYENREWVHPYRETDRLGGHDPYSSSKAAMEIALASWRRSFFRDHPVRIVSARAGNVIGGGDWAPNRILPDIVRALRDGVPVAIRNPSAVRPFQHVLEPLSGYLRLAERLAGGDHLRDAYNFGPEPQDVLSVRDLVETALAHWPGVWRDTSDPAAPHEAGLLALGIEAARRDLGYAPRWDSRKAVTMSLNWYRGVLAGADAAALTSAQIEAFGPP